MISLELKKAYNGNLKRFFNAVTYLDDPKRTSGEIEAWMPDYKIILKNQAILKEKCKLETGTKEVIEGFEI